MTNIIKAPGLHPFTGDEKARFLTAVSEGHDEEMAMYKAGLDFQLLSDLLASIPPTEMAKAKMRAKVPLATVKERMNDIMRNAKDEDDPMTPEMALNILERQDPAQWGKRTQISVTPPEPALPIEERQRLETIMGLPVTTFIEGHVVSEASDAGTAQ